MINVGHNYGRKIPCPICKLNIGDTQNHMFNCIIMKISCKELYNNIETKYEDIFSQNLQKLLDISKLCESLARKRNEIVS